MTEKISNAVVLHGPGRSGTTLFSRILSTHSAFAWISGYVNRFPGYPFLAVFNRVMEIDTVERFSRSRRFWPRPAEAYNFWNRYFPHFSEPEIRGRTKQHDRPDECIAGFVSGTGLPYFVQTYLGTRNRRCLPGLRSCRAFVERPPGPRYPVLEYAVLQWQLK